MARHPRNAPGGYVYHALNRATARWTLFRKPADYDAFLRILDDALVECPIRLLALCVMPTHLPTDGGAAWPTGAAPRPPTQATVAQNYVANY
jgi:hypothetical protein